MWGVSKGVFGTETSVCKYMRMAVPVGLHKGLRVGVHVGVQRRVCVILCVCLYLYRGYICSSSGFGNYKIGPSKDFHSTGT